MKSTFDLQLSGHGPSLRNTGGAAGRTGRNGRLPHGDVAKRRNMTMTGQAILIIQQDGRAARGYAEALEDVGHRVMIAKDAEEAVALLSGGASTFSCSIIDGTMPGLSTAQLVKEANGSCKDHLAIVMTSDASLSWVAPVFQAGAYDVIEKPVSAARLVQALTSAISQRSVPHAVVAPPAGRRAEDGFMGFVGVSPSMRALYRQIELVAPSSAPVFVTGESGTGKEVCAEAIHRCSERSEKPFVAINCGAIPGELLESELFGHARGSFTGAHTDRTGLVASAAGGTLFLDEICEMDAGLQVKLLRFLQGGHIQRVGSTDSEPVDVRVICATNQDVQEAVATGRLREDLYYRLAVVPIVLPPLRTRGDDCILLANHFLRIFAAAEGKIFSPLGQDFTVAAARHEWRGNVRELQNLIRRAVIMCPGPGITPASVFKNIAAAPASLLDGASRQCSGRPPAPVSKDDLTLGALEAQAIEAALERSGGNLGLASRKLGISPSTLYRRRSKLLSRSFV